MQVGQSFQILCEQLLWFHKQSELLTEINVKVIVLCFFRHLFVDTSTHEAHNFTKS